MYWGWGSGTGERHHGWAWGDFWEWCSLTWLCWCVHGCIHTSKHIKLYALNTCSSVFFNYTSIKIFLKSKKGNNWKWQPIQIIKKGAKVTMHFSWKLQWFHLYALRNVVVLVKVAPQDDRSIFCSLNLAIILMGLCLPHQVEMDFSVNSSRALMSVYEYISY